MLNGDEPLLWEKRGMLGFETYYYGIHNPDADLCARIVGTDGGATVFDALFDGRTQRVRLPAVGGAQRVKRPGGDPGGRL